MSRYRKKPVVVEAFQWVPELGAVGGVERDYTREGLSSKGSEAVCWMVRTLEGKHEVTPGDWIITGIKGERYPCKPDIFEATYEPEAP